MVNYNILTYIILIIYTLFVISTIYCYIIVIKKRREYIINIKKPYYIILCNIFYTGFVFTQIINDLQIIECITFEILTSTFIILFLNTFILQ